MLTTTKTRVSDHTSAKANERIQQQIENTVRLFASATPQMINRRLAELDREWDIERYVETMAPAITLFGLVCGATIHRRWLLLSGVVQSFFLQHAIQGWCPPIPVLRRLGIRTMDEINQERYALKVLRGDFRHVYDDESRSQDSDEVLEAVRR